MAQRVSGAFARGLWGLGFSACLLYTSPVGGGVHERFIINNAKFAAKAEAKKG